MRRGVAKRQGIERGAGRAARSYTYTAEDVARMVAAKRARGGGGRNRAAEKARLLRLREHARESGAAEELAECARVAPPCLKFALRQAGRVCVMTRVRKISARRAACVWLPATSCMHWVLFCSMCSPKVCSHSAQQLHVCNSSIFCLIVAVL